MKKELTIIGGGLVGSLAAVLFRKHNFDVQLIEKSQDIRKLKYAESRSINLVVTSRGIHALKRAQLWEAAKNISVPIRGRKIHHKNGETTYQPYGKADECNWSISRLALNKLLLNAAEESGAKILFEHEVKSVNFESGDIDFENLNLKTQNYINLLATDGGGSNVRKNFQKNLGDQFKNRTEWLEIDYVELTIPAAADGSYRLERENLHIWPRGHHMMMALANLDGSFTVTLYMPRIDSEESFQKVNSSEAVLAYFKKEFPDAIQHMPQFVEEYMGHPRGRLGTVFCEPWIIGDTKRTAVLCGDAAHAIVPFFGQGMNCGFEDLFILDDALKNNSMNFELAAQYFFKTQKPNSDAIARMAIENWHEMSKKVADPNFLLQKKLESQLEAQFPQLFKSRYGMVTYTLIPYSKIEQFGEKHRRIFSELLPGFKSHGTFNQDQAFRLLQKEFSASD